MISMRLILRLILYTACLASIALCTLLLMQRFNLLHSLHLKWGEERREDAFGIETNRRIILRAYLVDPVIMPVDGTRYPTIKPISAFDFAGIHYERSIWISFNKVTDGDITYIRLDFAFPWALALSAVLTFLCVLQFRGQRKLNPHACQTCGYDLRATPDRCPECGDVPTVL